MPEVRMESDIIEVSLTIDEVRKALGPDADEFIEIMRIVDDILENEDKYTGVYALKTANKLAAYRLKISAKASFYKTAGTSITNKRRKNTLIAMEHAMEENINCLKLLGKVDARSAGIL